MKWFYEKVTEVHMRGIAAVLTIAIILFPPYETYIIRNGVELTLSMGHHFILTDVSVGNVSATRVFLYIAFVWMIYILSSLLHRYIASKYPEKLI